MGQGWNVAGDFVSDTIRAKSQAGRIVSRSSSAPGAPIGFGFLALDFLWFFLVSRQERTYKWLFAVLYGCDATIQPCSLANSWRTSLPYWITIPAINVTPLWGWKRCSLVVENNLTPSPLLIGEGRSI